MREQGAPAGSMAEYDDIGKAMIDQLGGPFMVTGWNVASIILEQLHTSGEVQQDRLALLVFGSPDQAGDTVVTEERLAQPERTHFFAIAPEFLSEIAGELLRVKDLIEDADTDAQAHGSAGDDK